MVLGSASGLLETVSILLAFEASVFGHKCRDLPREEGEEGEDGAARAWSCLLRSASMLKVLLLACFGRVLSGGRVVSV